ncbi:MAG: ABC transporter ATP-binding protein [Bacillota bacterium]|nr:ABC transporter ATP-binding protein [Bacillota bacterium]
MKLSVKNLHFSYRTKYQTVHAVKDVTMDLESGKMYALIGKSGCGKTTLLSLLAGLAKADKGEIVYDGKALAEIDPDAYRRSMISVIYQSFNLFPLLNVIENVMFPLLVSGMRKGDAVKKSANMLHKVGLGENYHRRLPSMLSGGEQQRVAIARALATDAGLILADEPTGNLDAENALQVVNLLKQITEDGTRSVLIVTHDMSVAGVADDVFEMESGRLKEQR